MSGDGPADFERCLQLSTADAYKDELFATLTALVSYCVPGPSCAGPTSSWTRWPEASRKTGPGSIRRSPHRSVRSPGWRVTSQLPVNIS